MKDITVYRNSIFGNKKNQNLKNFVTEIHLKSFLGLSRRALFGLRKTQRNLIRHIPD